MIHTLTQNDDPAATTTYAELIALKPGFHEAWLHDDFPNDVHEGPEMPRGRVFAILRGSPLDLIELDGRYPEDVRNPDQFLRYASCAVTEGPFVWRSKPDVSYYEELKLVSHLASQTHRRAILQKSFSVLDACQQVQGMDETLGVEQLIEHATAHLVRTPTRK